MSLNMAGKTLEEKGIHTDFGVILDARSKNTEFLGDHATAWLLASQCHPEVFEAAKDKQVLIWHHIADSMERELNGRAAVLVGGGFSVGLSALCLAYAMGYRTMHLFGYDSCHRDGKGHAAPQKLEGRDVDVINVYVGNRNFKCSYTMAAQAREFEPLARLLAENGCEIHVHGSGLIPYIAQLTTMEKAA